jgi:hypothetical protein
VVFSAGGDAVSGVLEQSKRVAVSLGLTNASLAFIEGHQPKDSQSC